MDPEANLERVNTILSELGIPLTFGADRKIPFFEEAVQRVPVGLDIYGRQQTLEPVTAEAWEAMRTAAHGNGIVLQLVSGFRSIEQQREILKRKLEKQLKIHEILRTSAAPGYSEHHTGRAIDMTTPGSTPLNEEFEKTRAFEWLGKNSARFGFEMSYPRGNPHGFVYEPWHWCHQS